MQLLTRETRSIEIGVAGEHIVCADIILSGHRAFLSSQGLPYDVIADINGRMVRVIVKSTRGARPRPAREGSRVCYQFGVGRPRHLRGGKLGDCRPYTAEHGELVALVALDSKLVAYIPLCDCKTSMHINHDAVPGGNGCKRFADFPLVRALRILGHKL